MSKIIHKICPVCESSKLRSKFHGKDYSHSQENFEVLVCELICRKEMGKLIERTILP